VRDELLEQYFSESISWDTDRIAQTARSERRAWQIALAGWICALACALALLALMPLKRVEPFVVRVDNSTGIVDVVPVYAGEAGLQQTVTRYFLSHYVSTCERFSFATAESDYEECGAFHGAQRNQAWYTLWNPNNPSSPLNVHKDSQEYRSIRARWAVLTNEALREANIAARVDHRSLAEQGVDKEPQPRIPLKHLKMEQRGIRSEVAERLRAEYRERVRQRMERATETSRAQATAASTSQSWQPVSRQSSLTAPTRDLEEVRRQAREAWLRLRPPKEAERVGQLPDKHAAQQSSRESERGEEPAPPAEEELGL
jgi:type IV secretory pathway component VirB8